MNRIMESLGKDVKRVWRRRNFAKLFYLFFGAPIIAAAKYRYPIKDIEKHRKFYKELTGSREPLIICSNHLSYVDSILMIRAFGNHAWYTCNFRRHAWNLAAANYSSNFIFRAVGFFCKCIFIDREGSKEHKNRILDIARELLRKGEVLMVFPEGKRSRLGHFDDRKLAYGIGKIISELPKARVLCVYLRAANQKEISSYPPSGSEFELTYELKNYEPKDYVEPVSEITSDIARTIQGLEKTYFENHKPNPTLRPA